MWSVQRTMQRLCVLGEGKGKRKRENPMEYLEWWRVKSGAYDNWNQNTTGAWEKLTTGKEKYIWKDGKWNLKC